MNRLNRLNVLNRLNGLNRLIRLNRLKRLQFLKTLNSASIGNFFFFLIGVFKKVHFKVQGFFCFVAPSGQQLLLVASI